MLLRIQKAYIIGLSIVYISQKAVFTYFTSKQILPFGFAKQYYSSF